jgi:hypothetical protein
LLLPLLAPLLLLLLLLLLGSPAAAAPLLLLLFCTLLFVLLLGPGILLPPALLLLLLLLLLAPGFGVLLPLLVPCRLNGSTFVVPPGCRGVPETPTWKRALSLPVSSLQNAQNIFFSLNTRRSAMQVARSKAFHACQQAAIFERSSSMRSAPPFAVLPEGQYVCCTAGLQGCA